MRQSKLFTKTRKDAPKDEVSKNAQLLIRAGYVHKEMAGVYDFLPLGVRVLNKIQQIVREEMDALGSQEVFLTTLQEKASWEKTGRWDDKVIDNWFKTELKNGTQVGLASTHEEALTALLRNYVLSFRDLPFSAYQIQTKFRNEQRAKSGIMRGREFLMKDMYSFSKDEKEHQEFYARAQEAYKRVFERVGLGGRTHMTFASGGSFAKYSHEYQAVTDAGEDLVYVDEKTGIAVNKEVLTDEVLSELGLNKADLVEKKAVEVGNIFSLGTKFSAPLELTYPNEKGEKSNVIMGCYGIGIGRLMGTIVEALSDDKGIVWPASVAPFKVHLVLIHGKDEGPKNYAEELYRMLEAKGVEVLYDDRELRAGEKFADSDLIGIPWRIVVSEKMMAEKAVELKNRATGEATVIAESALFAILTGKA